MLVGLFAASNAIRLVSASSGRIVALRNLPTSSPSKPRLRYVWKIHVWPAHWRALGQGDQSLDEVTMLQKAVSSSDLYSLLETCGMSLLRAGSRRHVC